MAETGDAPQRPNADDSARARAEQDDRDAEYGGFRIPRGWRVFVVPGAVHFALMEARMVLTSLLRDFEWELVPDQDLTFTRILVPRPRSGTIIDLRPQRLDR